MKKIDFFLFLLQYCLSIRCKNLLSILIFFTTNFLVAQNYYLYVASESDDTVSLLKFDGNKINEEKRIDVGFYPTEIEGPHGITVDPNGKFWYLTLAHGNPYGKIIKYSTKDNTAIDQTTLGLFPASMQISKITGFIYCVNFNLHGDMKPSTVSVIDAETMTEITKIKTGSMPHGSRISKDGLKQYSVAMMSGELFEIDALSLNVSRKLDLDNHSLMDHRKMDMGDNKMKHSPVKPTWVIPHPNKSLAYVAGNGSNEIIEINLNKWEVSKRIKIEKNPYNVEISPNGKLMVATLKGNGKTAIWDLNTGNLIKLLKNSTLSLIHI